MSRDNKIFLHAPISVVSDISAGSKEKASVLAFPEERQQDLQYIRSILVSAGTNKNGAHFLPSEMLKAHNTVVHKAIDIEHEEDKVIGHIYECAFLFKNGECFDPLALSGEYAVDGRNVEDVDMDIAIAGVIHKMRFPEVADEISSGLWKVSMECYFKDFDIRIGNTIITRSEATALGYDPELLVHGFVKLTAGTRELGVHSVSRVLRGITFSGMGIVKNPANPHSIILETAAHKEALEHNTMAIDLERIDNLRGNKVEIATRVEKTEDFTDNFIGVTPIVSSSLAGQVYVELDKETGGIRRILTTGKEAAALRWDGPGIGGPGSVSSWPDSVCKSFKKRLTKFNALDQSEGQVLQEHWCALFEEACPVIGASAKAPECLRNLRNSVTRDPKESTNTKTIREHVEDGPGNTNTTVLQMPVLVTSARIQEHKKDLERIKTTALEFRNSLRAYVSAEKKTIK